MIPLLLAAGALGAAGGVMNFASALSAAEAGKDAARYQAQLLANQAKQERLDRAAAELAERQEMRRDLSLMSAIYATSGVLMEGTPAQMVANQAAADEYNIQERNRFSRMRARGMQSQAQVLWAQARGQYRMAKLGAYAGLAQGLMSSAGTMYLGATGGAQTPPPAGVQQRAAAPVGRTGQPFMTQANY